MFTGVTIQNFRGFGNVGLTGLGRVTLVVGKNNTGKTSLLEAIHVLARPIGETMASLPGLFRAKSDRVDERFYGWLVKEGAGKASLSATGRSRQVVLAGTEKLALGAHGLHM